LELAGRDIQEYHERLPERSVSLKAQALADLEVMDEAERIAFEMPHSDCVKSILARMNLDRALALTMLGDVLFAEKTLNEAAAITKRLIETRSEDEDCLLLAEILTVLTRFYLESRQTSAASRAADSAREALQVVPSDRRSVEWENRNCAFLLSRYNMNYQVNRYEDAMLDVDEVIALTEKSVKLTNEGIQVRQLALAYMGKSNVHYVRGEYEQGVCWNEKSIELLQNSGKSGDNPYPHDLALIHINLGSQYTRMARHADASRIYANSIDQLEHLVFNRDRNDLVEYLAIAYLNRAVPEEQLGRVDASLALVDKAIDLLERMIILEGQERLTYVLANLYGSKGNRLNTQGLLAQALEYFTKAITIMQRRVLDQGYDIEMELLARLKASLADVLFSAGKLEESRNELQESIDLLSIEQEKAGNVYLSQTLEYARTLMKKISSRT
jgi:tetratricopeptide (TPR) repeat protein